MPTDANQTLVAGRVQSVALRLVSEREAEIEAFRATEYWSIEAMLKTTSGSSFTAALIEVSVITLCCTPHRINPCFLHIWQDFF